MKTLIRLPLGLLLLASLTSPSHAGLAQPELGKAEAHFTIAYDMTALKEAWEKIMKPPRTKMAWDVVPLAEAAEQRAWECERLRTMDEMAMVKGKRLSDRICAKRAFREAPLAGEGTSSFYRRKTIRLVVGHRPGGTSDTYARLVARHLGRHVPGNPQVLVVNIPGQAGLAGANHFASDVDKDGLTIWQPAGSTLLAYLLTRDGDALADLRWLGATGGTVVVAAHKAARIRTAASWLNRSGEPLVIGCTSRVSLTCGLALAVREFGGQRNTEIRDGYILNSDVVAALGHDVDAVVWRESERARFRPMVEKGDVRLLAYAGYQRDGKLDAAGIPYLSDELSGSANMAVLDLILTPATLAKAWTVAPETPKDRVKILQTAFSALFRDAAFLRAASRISFKPRSAGWVRAFIKSVTGRSTAEVLTRTRSIVFDSADDKVDERKPLEPPALVNDPCPTLGLERHKPWGNERHLFVKRRCL